MRGPSSSHTAASWRIARLAADMLNDRLEKALVEFDRKGAWAPNYREQGTTIGMNGGLLGLDITDNRMKSTASLARKRGIHIEYRISTFPTTHPNTVRLTLRGRSGKKMQIIAVSTGGGAFEIRSVDGFPVSLQGDRHAVLWRSHGNPVALNTINRIIPADADYNSEQQGDTTLHLISACIPFPGAFLKKIQHETGMEYLTVINPIMPVIPYNPTVMPFNDLPSLNSYLASEKKDPGLGQLGRSYEQSLTNLSESDLSGRCRGLSA